MVNICLSTRCKLIMDYLLCSKDCLSIEEISQALSISRRSVYYDLDKINEWMEYYSIPAIEIIRGRGIYLNSKQKALILSAMNDEKSLSTYILSPSERMHLIICVILSGTENLQIEDLACYCDVSRNTILNDFKNIAEELERYQLKIIYDLKIGYICVGDTIIRRTVFLYYFHRIYHLYSKSILKIFNETGTRENINYMTAIRDELGINYSDEFILSHALMLDDMKYNKNTLKLIGISTFEVMKTHQYITVKRILPYLPEQEAIYLALQLLGNKTYNYTSSPPEELSPLARALVDKFEELSAITINNKENLVKSIYSHLKNSWPRYYYGISSEGLLVLNEIMKSNLTIYELTRDSCSQLREFIKLPVNEMEIAYLALYFSSYIQQSYSYKNKLRILIVCLNGISTGNILKWEISKLLPCAKIIGVEAKPSEYSLRDMCDLVISTVAFKSDVPIEVVNARLSDEDRIRLLNRAKAFGAKRNPVNQMNIQNVLDIIGRYVDYQKLALIKRDIIGELGAYESNRSVCIDEYKGRGIERYLSPSKIVIANEFMNWREALYYTAEPLIKSGSIETEYINQICYQIEKLGLYMFLMPGLILAHGKPEMGVNNLDISIGIFKEPVFFDDQHQAMIVIVLCPIDYESHMDIIKDIMTVFNDPDIIKTLVEIDSPTEITNMITELLGEDNQ